MFDLFRGLKGIIKVSHVHIDSSIFRLHYSVTVTILLCFSIVVTTRQYVGNPIDCIHTKDIPEDVLNTYCWIHSTYTIPSAFWKRIGVDVVHPGIDKTVNPEERRYVKYYQWVCFCLFIQALFFYAPRWLWKSWESGKISSLKMDLDMPVIAEIEKRQKKKLINDYLSMNTGNHNIWCYKYFTCEILAMVNLLGQIAMMDKFFEGTFLTFGIEVIAFADRDQEDRVDPMVYIFPRMTKCTFHKFGSSGEIEKHDAMCILPINIVNEKIYVFLWFWFVLLILATLILFVYRVMIVVSKSIRVYILHVRFRLVKEENLKIIVKRTGIGDFMLVYLLGQNIDSLTFKEIIHEWARRLGQKDGLYGHQI